MGTRRVHSEYFLDVKKFVLGGVYNVPLVEL